ncbi:hypothetical protein ABGN05_20315 [Aquibium sp. LZ166]|uniref:DUF3102 domain-containing protein n=1 Tax=Aquibium pacificus TaxID=3153579 RepID=A0ABV3SML1_9HYPH
MNTTDTKQGAAPDYTADIAKIEKLFQGLNVNKVEIGKELRRVKKEVVPHGQFEQWCEDYLKRPKRTLEDYMKMSRAADGLEKKGVDFTLFRASALAKIGTDSCTEEALEAIVAKFTKDGKAPSYDNVVSLIAAHKKSRPVAKSKSAKSKGKRMSAAAKTNSATISGKVETAPKPSEQIAPPQPDAGETQEHVEPVVEQSISRKRTAAQQFIKEQVERLLALLEKLEPHYREEGRKCLTALGYGHLIPKGELSETVPEPDATAVQ